MTDDVVTRKHSDRIGPKAPDRRTLLKGIAAVGAASGAAALAIADAPSAGATANTPSPAVQAVSVSNVSSLSGQPIIDGYQTTNSDRVLLAGQTTGSQNGLWALPSTGTGSWIRPGDFTSGSNAQGVSVLVNGGTVFKGTLWMCASTTSVKVDTAAETWQLLSGRYAVPGGQTDPSVVIDQNGSGQGFISLGDGTSYPLPTSLGYMGLVTPTVPPTGSPQFPTLQINGHLWNQVLHSIGTIDPTYIMNVPGASTVGLATAGLYSDGSSGQIFHFASQATNSMARNTVAVYGSGVGYLVWGGNFVGYNTATAAAAQSIGVEIDFGVLTSGASGGAGGLLMVSEGGVNPSTYFIVMQAKSGSPAADGILFNAWHGNPAVGSSGALIATDASNTATYQRGIDFRNTTFTMFGIGMNGNSIVGVSDLAVTGITGAVDPMRLVGATFSGAPTSGSFVVGDVVVDQTGRLWICTTAGTPGTWHPAGSGYEILRTIAVSGSSFTLNLNTGSTFEITLTANCTLSLSNVPASTAVRITLLIHQDGTGSRTVTWPTTTKWPGGTPPTLSTAASAIDKVTLTTTNGGTTWYGQLDGKGFA
jgi:hypothetical protein